MSRSFARPLAALAMRSAVAGATTITSELSARAMCSMLDSDSTSKSRVTTGLWVKLRNVSGVTNSRALPVITTSTSAPR